VDSCAVLSCENEVYGKGVMCKNCQEIMGDKEKYVLLICWGCGQIIDIFHKEIKESIIFAAGCRECGNKRQEKDTFLVDRDG